MTRFTAALLAALGAATVSAHYAWIETSPVLRPGEKVQIKIGYGHEVTNSESAVSMDKLELWAIDPSGTKTALKPIVSDKWVIADFTAKEKGVYRFVLTQDRGVMSQTTKGFKAGGRDVHPDAKKSMKLWRSAVTYSSTDGVKYSTGKPLGLPFEVVADRKGDSLELTVLRDGKASSGTEIGLNVPGKEEADPVGKTDGNGRFVYKVPAGTKGPMLFVATSVEPAQKGANYDTNNLTSVLEVTW
jgi:uncharacterized GH25 family protein